MKPASVVDYRRLARRRLPAFLFDYVDGGALDEGTMRANRRAFGTYSLTQRALQGHEHRELGTHFLGAAHRLPVMLGPVGLIGLLRSDGEIKAARAARQAGIPICLSTFAINGIEDIHAAHPSSTSMQIYLFRDRGLAEALLARLEQIGVDAIFLTVDSAVGGIRYRDRRHGFGDPSGLSARMILSMLCNPRWLIDIGRRPGLRVGNFPGDALASPGGLQRQIGQLARQFDPCVTLADIDWLRSRWRGRLIVKGVLCVDDAAAAAAHGADGIVVSNHGGRQLDGAEPAIDALPRIADRLAGSIELFMDSGIRTGADIAKALGLGADAVLLGRAYVWGLAARGQVGVADVITMLRAELDVTMALMGVASVAELRAGKGMLVKKHADCRCGERSYDTGMTGTSLS